MIFKKTFLALSLCAVSAFAVAAPAVAPAPAAATLPNLVQGAPAYVFTGSPFGFTAYTPLMDDDRIHVGGIGQGAWTGFTTEPTMYIIDLSGAPCMDKFGSCAGKPGTGTAEVNTVVVYFEQVQGTEQEPTDTTLAHKPTSNIWLSGYQGATPGVNLALLNEKDPDGTFAWKGLGDRENNTLAKQTFTFPTAKYSKLRIDVLNAHFSRHTPRIVHVDAFNRPATPAKP